MKLPEERWKEEEIVRLSIRWRNTRRQVQEVFTSGSSATTLWKGLHAHLQNRIRDLLNMTPYWLDHGSVTLETADVVKLDEVNTLWIEDGQGRTFTFERYGSDSIPVPPSGRAKGSYQ